VALLILASRPLCFAKAVISQVLAQKDKYGQHSFGEGKTVIIDFSSPNVARKNARWTLALNDYW